MIAPMLTQFAREMGEALVERLRVMMREELDAQRRLLQKDLGTLGRELAALREEVRSMKGNHGQLRQ